MKLSWMDLYNLVDKSLYRNQTNLFGKRLWSVKRLLTVLVSMKLGSLETDREGYFKSFKPITKLTPQFINELLWSLDPKSVKEMKVKK